MAALIHNGRADFPLRRGRTLSNREYHEQAIARGEMVLAESEKKRAASRAATSDVRRGPADETAASPSPAPEPTRPIDRRREGKRTKMLVLRLTPEEHALIKSQRHGTAVAQWIRESAVERAMLARNAYRWDP